MDNCTSPGLTAVPSKKVYIISTSSNGVFGDNPGSPMNIFCVDLQSEPKSKGFSFLRPKVRLCDRAFNGAAFCIFELTLYVFQGYDSKSIYSYKLEANFKRMMEEVGCMKTLKHSPTAGKNILFMLKQISNSLIRKQEAVKNSTNKLC